jgi:hypothetical protein
LIVDTFIDVLNVIEGTVFSGTPVAPFAGETAMITGAGSGVAAIVEKDALNGARESPARSRIPVVTVMVYSVELSSGVAGVNVARTVAGS